nr:immunoglobulin heavy chain junction region [Macaca mulatta]MPN83857.1 immunoglobulin heavy chain junction region [Macaca mulatta]MPN83860.1 immunoglobulin heavy chain junction region [Macaca mulatta]MPN83869.1 immunoglobulin heavy chain junction region [Macaca mulatta]MPN83872.1 immunoglobulin heavy chain junction region [Macaca mulatta]
CAKFTSGWSGYFDYW